VAINGYNPLLAWNSSAFASFRVNHVRVISAAEDLVAALQPRGIDGTNVVEVLGGICPRDLKKWCSKMGKLSWLVHGSFNRV
jgi:hypothetical protein